MKHDRLTTGRAIPGPAGVPCRDGLAPGAALRPCAEPAGDGAMVRLPLALMLGILAGIAAAGVALLAGYGFLTALLSYMAAGTFAMLAALLATMR